MGRSSQLASKIYVRAFSIQCLHASQGRQILDLGALDVDLGDGRTFRFAEYLRGLAAGTTWLAREMEQRLGMLSFVTAWRAVHKPAKRHPERGVKSFVLSEAESFSREAKAEWCAQQPHAAACSLQHDGVVVALGGGMSVSTVCEQLQRVSSAVVGYEQACEPKRFDVPEGAHAPPRADLEVLAAELGALDRIGQVGQRPTTSNFTVP